MYGDRLCFWGSIDEQHTLPFGTPDDMRREVATRLDTIGRGGGLAGGPGDGEDHAPDLAVDGRLRRPQ